MDYMVKRMTRNVIKQVYFKKAIFSPYLQKYFEGKVHIFWEGHKILRNLPRKFDWHWSGDFSKFCGLLRIYELYKLEGGPSNIISDPKP